MQYTFSTVWGTIRKKNCAFDFWWMISAYTKHHLKFRKNQADILEYMDFGADFSFIFLVFSIMQNIAVGMR